MADNKLNVRILICNDTEVNWNGDFSKVLLKGEIGIAFPTDATKEPILKVGDGVNKFKDLKQLNVRPSELNAIADKVGDLSTLKTTEKTDVVKAINELVESVKSAGAVAIDTSTTTPWYLKSYKITQGIDTNGDPIVIGIIDIPKDIFPVSGTVETYTDATLPTENGAPTTAGTYIKIVIENQNDPIYINANSLVDDYKAKGNASQIQISIDATTREISAEIVNGAIGSDELADDSVITDKIKDKNVTKEKLAQDVQDALDNASDAITGVMVNSGLPLQKDHMGRVNITSISTDMLANGRNTLVLDGGNSDGNTTITYN